MYSQFLDKTLCVEAVLDHPVLKELQISFKCFLKQKKESRTARLDTVFGNDTNLKIIYQSREDW